MKYIFIVVFLLSWFVVGATNYYCSGSGNDNNKGDMLHPFRTLNRLNKVYPMPGDSLLLKSGNHFYGFINSCMNGTSSKPIYIGTYGNRNPAIISGTTVLSKWINAGNGIYASDTFSLTSTLRNVIIDNQQAEQGRYPNDYPGTGGFLQYGSYQNNTGNSVISCGQLQQYGIDQKFIGATIKIKPYLSDLESGEILNISNGYITFNNGNMFYQLGYNYCGFYITNSLYTLDKFGEWYYSPVSKRLYIYFGANNPVNHTVEVSTVNKLAVINNSNYKINNIIFSGANEYGIYSTTPRNNLSVKKIQILKTGITGIAVANITGLTVDSSTIDGANTTGINVGYKCEATRVINTIISNIGMLPTNIYCDSAFQKRMGYGIYSGYADKGIYVENVTATNIAYIGVFFTGNNNTIYRSAWINTCMYLDDGGAIYYGGWRTYIGYNNTVSRNIILNCKGYWFGFPINHGIPNSIFIDDRAGNVTIDSNYIQGSGQSCLYIHNGYNCRVTNNCFANAKLSLFVAQDDYLGDRVQGLYVKNNTLYTADTSQLMYCFYSSGDTADNYISQFGSIDSNYLLRPNILNSYIAHGDTFNLPGARNYKLADLQSVLRYAIHDKPTDTYYRQIVNYYAIKDTVISLIGDWQTPKGEIKRGNIKLKDHTFITLLKIPTT